LLTVDVHTHFVPHQVAQAARQGGGFDGLRMERSGGQEWLTHRQGFSYPLPPPYYDVEARLRAMDERLIDHAVMSLAPTLFMYWVAGAEADDFCRSANNALAAFAKEAGGRVTPVATLPMQHPDEAAAELRRAVTELGMRGAQIGPGIEEMPLDDERFGTVLQAAEDLGVPLILHPYYVGPRPGLEDFYLTNLVGNPLATTVCAARLIFGGVLDRLAGLRLVLMHGGGYLPYQIGRLDHGHRIRPESAGCQQDPSSYLRRFWFDTVTHGAVPLRFLADMVGTDRVLYGTDYPFDMAAGPLPEQVSGTGLGDEDLVKIAGTSARDLFGLHQPLG
jgi:aminocarboxymuconate-semialdehyde decarboxylase